ncbi:MAG: DUF3618 domain-containing protein [Variibacter sp.]|nr:DUF3618 domain-containing protein [Variibacter sp.]
MSTYGNGYGKSASTLEHEAEETRARLAATLDEFRSSMSPGQILDQALRYAQASGGVDFMRNLGRQAQAHPLAVALVGAGIGWLMLSDTRPGQAMLRGAAAQPSGWSGAPGEPEAVREAVRGAREATASAADMMRDRAASAAAGARGAVSGLTDAARAAGESAAEMGSRAADMASGAAATIRETGAALGDKAAAAADAAAQARQRMSAAGSSAGDALTRAFREQPVLLGALGLAVGAIIGAALPRTRMEDAHLGPMRDKVTEQMKEAAAARAGEMAEAGRSAVDAAQEEVRRQGTDEAAAEKGAAAAAAAGPGDLSSPEPRSEEKGAA